MAVTFVTIWNPILNKSVSSLFSIYLLRKTTDRNRQRETHAECGGHISAVVLHLHALVFHPRPHRAHKRNVASV